MANQKNYFFKKNFKIIIFSDENNTKLRNMTKNDDYQNCRILQKNTISMKIKYLY